MLWCRNVKTSLKILDFEAAVDRAPAFLLLFDCSTFASSLSRKLHVFSQIIGISFLFWGYLPFNKKLDFIRHLFNPKSFHFFLLDFAEGAHFSVFFFASSYLQLHYSGNRTNLFCYIFHILWIWQKFSFHSCLQLLGDGANWTKTVFHCGLTGSCESIYSLTAMRQNGPWKRSSGRGLSNTRESSHGVVSSDNLHILHQLCVLLKKRKKEKEVMLCDTNSF